MSNDFERGPVARPALARCVGIDASEFGAEYWGVKPLLTRAADLPQGFADLFAADDVDELIARRALRTPFVRMAKEGSILAAGRYTASGGFGAEVPDQLDSGKVLEEFSQGSTIVLQGLHRTWGPITDFTRQLVADIGHPCQVNAYVTPASSRGFDPHYDVHDVFVIQVHGEKRWIIHPPVHQDPLGDQPWTDHTEAIRERSTKAAAIDATLHPGDVLYLPRGWIHSATALGGTSIHLTVGVAALTRADVVEQLVAGAMDELSLRRSLPLGIDLTDAEQLRPIVDETVAVLAARWQSGAELAGPIAKALDRRIRTSTRPEAVRPIATIDAIVHLDADTIVAWRDGVAARIAGDDTTVSVSLTTKTLTLPVEAAKALATLHTGHPVRVGDLPGLDLSSAVVVVRRLLREAIVVVR